MTHPQTLRIDFVSDVSCPWCAVGLASLERALDALNDEVRAEIHFQPFELNPQMAAEGEDVGDREVLARVAEAVELDGAEARSMLASDRYVQEVRAQEQFFQRAGIHSVPAIIINRQHLISGGQPPEVFEQALRQIAGAG